MIEPEIKSKRKAAGLSQAAFADEVGVTQGAVSSWERGRAVPRQEQMEALERILGAEVIAAVTSPSQDYGEWLRGRCDGANLTREQLAAASGVSAIQIYNIE